MKKSLRERLSDLPFVQVIAEMVVTAGPCSTPYRRALQDIGLLRQRESGLAQARFTGP